MQPTHRKPPPKKRHTKPCRFFQTSRCPLSAQECDFLHVLSNEVPLQNPNPCRHVMEPSEDDAGTAVNQNYPQLQGTTTHKLAPTAELQPPLHDMYPTPSGGWQVPHPSHTASPTYSPAVPSPRLYYCDFYSPAHSVESSANLSASTSSSLSDDVLLVTDDPKYTEHYHQYQSQIRIADERSLVHVPPFYHHSPNPHAPRLMLDTSYPMLQNAYGAYAYQPPISPSSLIKPRVQPRSVSRHKTINYKTKPCRFYKASGTCPNNSECTFIHDEPARQAASPGESPVVETLQLAPGLPPKPVSPAEENRKRNFFPISWRVIGGGVLMGERKPAPVSQEQEEKAPSENTEKEENPSPPKPITRTRSSSNPPTPAITHVKVDALFSAESPGNL
ncbi:putative zinc finger C-x8-C-x5-C-x3-H type (and similar) [Lyophyllum shimeji]|uniref:Zinc finger C-x8-C-x5-C-x3-H type (And similar) n=1 Tax=Lyophyllum shimeji TaxID=47721 RepID=A0A9P3PNC1_LYOSH|nr:putative zinc finger C-x8-C-x5-C-x3-H type (and similar) [Lyophyllum shimeji]